MNEPIGIDTLLEDELCDVALPEPEMSFEELEDMHNG